MISEVQRGALFYLNQFDGYWEGLPSRHMGAADSLLKGGLIEKNPRMKKDRYHLTGRGKKELGK